MQLRTVAEKDTAAMAPAALRPPMAMQVADHSGLKAANHGGGVLGL